jgi:hypothetical protein
LGGSALAGEQNEDQRRKASHDPSRHKTNNICGRSTSTASWQRIVELLFDAKGVKMPAPYPWAASSSPW